MNDNEELAKAAQNAVEAMAKLMEAFAQALAPVVESVLEFAKQFYASVYEAYKEHGAIYGETHEGMMRWLEELGEIERLEQSANAIRERQLMVMDLQRMMNKTVSFDYKKKP